MNHKFLRMEMKKLNIFLDFIQEKTMSMIQGSRKFNSRMTDREIGTEKL